MSPLDNDPGQKHKHQLSAGQLHLGTPNEFQLLKHKASIAGGKEVGKEESEERQESITQHLCRLDSIGLDCISNEPSVHPAGLSSFDT